MAEHLEIANGGKEEKYALLALQVEALVGAETDLIAVLANASSMIHHTFGFLWTGFYIVRDGVLVVGPFQGPLACNRIKYGRGVCGTAWKEGRTLVVDDVDAFPGHIACSSASKSEIVVPVRAVAGPTPPKSASAANAAEVVAVIDIDSGRTAAFDAVDARWLERIAALLAPLFTRPTAS